MITYGDARDAALDSMFAERGGVTGWPDPSVVLTGGGTLYEGFETGKLGSFTGYAYSDATASVTTDQARTGSRSAVLNVDASGGYLYTTAALACTPGYVLSASGWIRGGGTYSVQASFLNSSGSELASTVVGTRTASGSSVWEQVTGSVTIPASPAGIVAVRIRFICSAGSPGPRYFDDLSIVGFDGALKVQQIGVTRELAGDLPDDVTLVAGAVSSSATVAMDLDDIGPHPARLAERATALGKPATIRAGYGSTYTDPVAGGVLRVPVYAGVLRTVGFDEAARSRSLTLMDRSDQMRAPVTIPPFGSYADRVRPEKVYRLPTNLSNVIACALHKSGIRCTPPPPSAGLVWSTPLVGGALAEVGFNLPFGHVPEGDTWLRAGPFGPMPTQPSTAGESWFVTGYPSRQITTESVLEVRAWLDTSATGGADELFALVVSSTGYTMYGLYDRAAGQVAVELRNPSNGVVARVTLSAATSSGVRCLQAQFRYGGAVTVAARLDTGTVATQTSSPTTIYADRPHGQAVSIRVTPGRIQQASLHATTSTAFTDPPAASGFPQADLDPAALDVDYFPGVDSRVAWELCKEIASAELGMVGFSEVGRFYFRNRATLNGTTTPALTFGTDLVNNIAGQASIDSVRDGVIVPCSSSWFLDSGIGVTDAGPGTGSIVAAPVHLAGDVLTIAPGTSSLLIKTARPILPDRSMIAFLDGSSGREVGRVYDATSIAISTSSTNTATVASAAGFYATLHPVDSTTWRLDVYSPASSVRYAVWPKAWDQPGNYYDRRAGQGSLIILGRVTDEDASVRSQAVTVGNTGPGARVATLPDSPWRQNAALVADLAAHLVADLAAPRLQLSDVNVPADLRLQVGDVVRLTDWAERVPSIDARVIRLRTTIGGRVPLGMTQTLSLRTL